MIDLSVLIATYNRSRDLTDVLRCLNLQELPKGLDHEVLVIDNNSTDGTQAVLRSFAPSFAGRLKALFEARQGKPYAINRGLKEARGRIVVLTDDDCVFEDDHLRNIFTAFEHAGPAVGFIGGRIDPRWVDCTKPQWFDELQPEWFKESFWGPLAILNYGDAPFLIDAAQVESSEKKLFYGANMAVRREIFAEHGDFNVNKPVAEDTELQLRLLKAGIKGLYAPHVRVCHKVTAARLTPRYYYRWYYSRGRYREILAPTRRGSRQHPGAPLIFAARSMRLVAESFFARNRTTRMHRRFEALFALGQMVQVARARHSFPA